MSDATDRSKQMLAAALQKEEWGRDFYLKAVSTCSNDLGKEMFRILAGEEGVHITRIREIYKGLAGGQKWTADWKAHKQNNENLEELLSAKMAAFGPRIKAETTDLEALNIALEFEQDAIQLFESELSSATDPIEREFITKMIAEERSHYASIANVKMFFVDPESWHVERERHGLDGG
jgi:rubrerythrin